MKTYILILLLIFLMIPTAYSQNDPLLRDKVSVVVIDPGHGGKDPGALGSKIKEKDVVLRISLLVGNYIKENYKDVKVIYTRDKDVFIPLDDRAKIANKNKADLFISIHANSLPKSPAYGTETFVMGISKDAKNFEVAKKENSVITLEENYETKYEGFDPNSIDSYIIFSVMQKTYLGQSISFAQLVEDQFKNRAKRFSRGVKQDAFWVLWRTTMPSVLIETGFLSNKKEEQYLGSREGQEIIASAIFRAFKSYKESIEKNTSHTNEEDQNILIRNSELSKDTPSDVVKSIKKDEDLHFKVQILVSRKQIESKNSFFKSYDDVEEIKSGSWYKYALGNKKSYKDVLSYCNQVKKDFPDAFIIAVKNGKIISLKDALEEIHQ